MGLVCAAVILIGFKGPLNIDDKRALNTAKKNCSKYYPDAPCLKKFIKREELVYWAICGKPNAN